MALQRAAGSRACAAPRSWLTSACICAVVIAGCGLQVVGTYPLETDADGATGPDATPATHGDLDANGANGEVDADTARPLLLVTEQPTGAVVDLAAEGKRDWVHWGYQSQRNEKVSGDGIGDYVFSPSSLPREYADSTTLKFVWKNGTPTAEQAGTTTYSYLNDADGIVATIPINAAKTTRTAHLYLGGKGSKVRFELSLSDGSAPPPPAIERRGDPFLTKLVVVFAAASDGAKLQAKCSLLERFTTDASVRIAAVTLSDGAE
jgi:hypothetical protein